MEQTFRKLVYFIGPPRNYGLSDEEIEKQRLIVEKQRIEFERAEEERLKQEIETAEAERNQRIKEWVRCRLFFNKTLLTCLHL